MGYQPVISLSLLLVWKQVDTPIVYILQCIRDSFLSLIDHNITAPYIIACHKLVHLYCVLRHDIFGRLCPLFSPTIDLSF